MEVFVNKVVLIIGSVTVIVVGGLFFLAGMFTGADLDTASIVTGKEAIQDGVASKLKASVANFLNEKDKTEIKVLEANDDTNMLDEDDLRPLQSSSQSGILFERPSPNVTIDTLLNEIISGHSTNDDCLTSNVKTEKKENVVLNDTKGNVVFIGYFPTETAKQVSKLVMAKGYPSHVQISNATDAEAFVFCGPFKKESSAKLLVSWLRKHDFQNAKIVKGNLLKSQKLDEAKINEEAEGIPTNLENKKAKPATTRKKNAKTTGNERRQKNKKKITKRIEEDESADVEEIVEEEQPHIAKEKTAIRKNAKPSSRNALRKQTETNEEEEIIEDAELVENEDNTSNSEEGNTELEKIATPNQEKDADDEANIIDDTQEEKTNDEFGLEE